MPDTPFFNDAERELNRREGRRLVDILAGRNDGRTTVANYLVLERPVLGLRNEREIWQYRDLERVVSGAADFVTGDQHGKALGAFTATYRDGMLVAVAMVDDLPGLVDAELKKRPIDRLNPLTGKPMLHRVAS